MSECVYCLTTKRRDDASSESRIVVPSTRHKTKRGRDTFIKTGWAHAKKAYLKTFCKTKLLVGSKHAYMLLRERMFPVVGCEPGQMTNWQIREGQTE